jgi:hypothetical protein
MCLIPWLLLLRIRQNDPQSETASCTATQESNRKSSTSRTSSEIPPCEIGEKMTRRCHCSAGVRASYVRGQGGGSPLADSSTPTPKHNNTHSNAVHSDVRRTTACFGFMFFFH